MFFLVNRAEREDNESDQKQRSRFSRFSGRKPAEAPEGLMQYRGIDKSAELVTFINCGSIVDAGGIVKTDSSDRVKYPAIRKSAFE